VTVSIVETGSGLASTPVGVQAEHVRSERIVAIQVLRAVAAIMVVAYHFQIFLGRATGGPTGLPNLQDGTAGVDLFFVISGFVIVYASEPLFGKAGGPAAFIAHRLVRIVPLYWLVTTLYLIIGLARPEMGKIYSFGYVAASYLFFPMARPDNDLVPVVSQGWSLNYEMLFYVVFTAAVVLPRRNAVVSAALAIAVLVPAGVLLHPARQPYLFWTASIMIEFVFGMVLAAAYREGARLPQWLALGVIAAGIALFAAGMGSTRVLHYGVPAALAMMGAIFGNFSLQSRLWQFVGLVGDASYSLYLIHLLPILATLFIARHAGIPLTAAAWPLLFTCVLAATALSIAVHLALERPVTRALRRFTSPARPHPAFNNIPVRP
jgi:peptidoglycan/LPS O-acetylase OafA/YrhL